MILLNEYLISHLFKNNFTVGNFIFDCLSLFIPSSPVPHLQVWFKWYRKVIGEFIGDKIQEIWWFMLNLFYVNTFI